MPHGWPRHRGLQAASETIVSNARVEGAAALLPDQGGGEEVVGGWPNAWSVGRSSAGRAPWRTERFFCDRLRRPSPDVIAPRSPSADRRAPRCQQRRGLPSGLRSSG